MNFFFLLFNGAILGREEKIIFSDCHRMDEYIFFSFYSSNQMNRIIRYRIFVSNSGKVKRKKKFKQNFLWIEFIELQIE